MKKILIILSVLLLIAGCQPQPKELSEAEIDQIVDNITDPEHLYDIGQSMRFSRDDQQYDAIEYSMNDTVVLYIENYEDEDKMYNRQIFFYNNQPIFINEIGYRLSGDEEEQYQQKIYINNGVITSAYERIIEEEDIDTSINYKTTKVDIAQYDFDKPKNAVNQKGEFEMKFGEFLTIATDTYLILDNKKSKYTVALYIIEGDETLNTLFENKEALQGKTVFAYHEFVNMGGINRMLYKGSYFVSD